MPPVIRLAVLAILALLVLSVGIYLATDLEPPTHRIEQVIPSDRFAR
jgi:hypothetical protein